MTIQSNGMLQAFSILLAALLLTSGCSFLSEQHSTKSDTVYFLPANVYGQEQTAQYTDIYGNTSVYTILNCKVVGIQRDLPEGIEPSQVYLGPHKQLATEDLLLLEGSQYCFVSFDIESESTEMNFCLAPRLFLVDSDLEARDIGGEACYVNGNDFDALGTDVLLETLSQGKTESYTVAFVLSDEIIKALVNDAHDCLYLVFDTSVAMSEGTNILPYFAVKVSIN